MYEAGAAWTLTGSDGTVATFNDGNGLYIEEVSGWDSPSIRTNVEDNPEDDGATAGDSWLGQRAWTLSGKIVGQSASGRNLMVVSLQRALRGMRADCLAKSSPQGLPAMQSYCRVSGFRLSGAFVKDFQIQMISADPRAYSQTLNTQTDSNRTPSPGAAFNLVFPIAFGGTTGAVGQVSCTNAGNYPTPPVLVAKGPISDPYFENVATGERIVTDGLTLDPGDTLTIDVAAKTAVDQDGVNRYSKVLFPDSSWWQLQPGAQTIRLWGSGNSSTTELDVSWRDAWC